MSATKTCPYCAEEILAVAKKCRHCGEFLDESLRGRGTPGAGIGDDAGLRMLLPVGRSPWALISGYLGLLSLLFVFAPFALITGVVAIYDIRKHPSKHGMGRAIFGVVMGAVFSVLFLVILLRQA